MGDILFTDLTLSDPLLAALLEMGYENPTPVQESAIPMASTGQDLIVQSQTGTGKTAAFGIPLIEALEPEKGIRGLVLCPTRELAKQVAEEAFPKECQTQYSAAPPFAHIRLKIPFQTSEDEEIRII